MRGGLGGRNLLPPLIQKKEENVEPLTPLQIALKYAALGWKLFPARWNNGHKPLIKWKDGSSSDPTTIATWASKWKDCYFCVATRQSNITIIDVDNKKGKRGSDTLFNLELDHGPLPKTLTISTPSGGRHYIFKNSTPITVEKLGRGIDTPVMTPLPGTLIPEKGRYEIVVDVTVAPLPEWVARKLGEIREVAKDRGEPLVELDLPHNIFSAIRYLQTQAPLSFMGEGGDTNAFQIACKVRDFGISEACTLEFLLEHWNERCEPPWSPKELQQTVKNAYDYAQDRAGKNTIEAEFDIIPTPETELTPINSSESPTSEPQDGALVNFTEFTGVPLPRDWVVESILPMREISAMYGDGGLGKSRLVKQLALKIAAGLKDFAGMKVQKQLPVLGVFCEDDKQEIHRRIYEIRKNPEYEFLDNNIPFYIDPRAGESSLLGIQDGSIVKPGPFYGPLVEKIKQVGKGGDIVLILDTLADIFAINENDRQAANFCIKTLLGGLVKNYKCTILVVAHPSKTSQRDKIYDSGSTAWRNSIRNMLVMTPHDNPNLKNYRMLLHTKSNYAATIDPVLLHWEKGCFVVSEEDNIIDDITEKNMAALLALVTEMCQKGTPLGLHHNKHPNLYRVGIKDAGGGKMSKETKTKLIDELIRDGIVEEVRGEAKSSENGLWPTILLGKEGEK